MKSVIEIVRAEMLKEWHANNEARKSHTPRFHDSDAGKCLRQRVVKRARLVEPMPPLEDGLMVMEIGSLVHEAIQKRLISAGAVPVEDVEIVDRDEHTSGRSDFIMDMSDEVSPDAGFFLHELKTTAHSAFKFLEIEGVKHGHKLQAIRGWIKMKKKEKYKNLRGIIITYISREYGNVKSFGIIPTDDLIAECLADIAAEEAAWGTYQETKELPPEIAILEPYTVAGVKYEKKAKNAWECIYCSFYKACAPVKALVAKDSPERDFQFWNKIKKPPVVKAAPKKKLTPSEVKKVVDAAFDGMEVKCD